MASDLERRLSDVFMATGLADGVALLSLQGAPICTYGILTALSRSDAGKAKDAVLRTLVPASFLAGAPPPGNVALGARSYVVVKRTYSSLCGIATAATDRRRSLSSSVGSSNGSSDGGGGLVAMVMPHSVLLVTHPQGHRAGAVYQEAVKFADLLRS